MAGEREGKSREGWRCQRVTGKVRERWRERETLGKGGTGWLGARETGTYSAELAKDGTQTRCRPTGRVGWRERDR